MCFRDPAGEIAGGFGETAFDLVPTIAFASSRDNPTLLPVLSWSEIYLLDIDFTNPRRLTYNDASDIFPALSPDGKKIVFESGRLRQPTDPTGPGTSPTIPTTSATIPTGRRSRTGSSSRVIG
jgi:Tol biopolymer transport system component